MGRKAVGAARRGKLAEHERRLRKAGEAADDAGAADAPERSARACVPEVQQGFAGDHDDADEKSLRVAREFRECQHQCQRDGGARAAPAGCPCASRAGPAPREPRDAGGVELGMNCQIDDRSEQHDDDAGERCSERPHAKRPREGGHACSTEREVERERQCAPRSRRAQQFEPAQRVEDHRAGLGGECREVADLSRNPRRAPFEGDSLQCAQQWQVVAGRIETKRLEAHDERRGEDDEDDDEDEADDDGGSRAFHRAAAFHRRCTRVDRARGLLARSPVGDRRCAIAAARSRRRCSPCVARAQRVGQRRVREIVVVGGEHAAERLHRAIAAQQFR